MSVLSLEEFGQLQTELINAKQSAHVAEEERDALQTQVAKLEKDLAKAQST